MNIFENKKILITGGAGCIGSEIARRIREFNPDTIRIFDNNESGLYRLQQDMKDIKFRFFLGDLKDKYRLKRAVEDVDIVFHAAALKHVHICEYNPFDAVKTNVIGTQNLIDVALDENIEKLISISTDKATNPCGVMGATKLLSERLITAANFYKGKRKTVLSSVRFGNVIGSNGSVIPLFRKQIKNGGPVTVTDRKMTRFMMSIEDAVNLIFKATEFAKGGEIFILKMPALKIIDLAEAMIEELATRGNKKPEDIEIKFIGPRPGEKLHEELVTKKEAKNIIETDDMFIILPDTLPLDTSKMTYPGSKKAEISSYSSNANTITKDEIKKLLFG